MMTYEKTDAPAELLMYHDKMSVFVDPENPMFLNVIAFARDEGFSGATIVSDGSDDINDIFLSLDRSEISEDLSVSVAHATLIEAWVEKAVSDPEPGEEDVCPYREFMRAEIPDATCKMFQDMPWLTPNLSTINYFCTGNTEMRRESAYALPIMTPLLIQHKDAAAVIDTGQRADVLAMVADIFEADREDLKKMVRLENMAAQNLSRGEGVEDIGRMSRVFNGRPFIEELGLLNSSQFPSDLKNANAAIACVRRNISLGMSLGIGPAAHLRAMRKIGPDGWVEALEDLPDTAPREQRDFLARIEQAVMSAVVVGQVRQSAPDLMEAVNQGAEALWNDEVIEPEVAEALTRYLNLMTGARPAWRGSEILRIVGEDISLKDIREFTTRWHHVQQTMDNETLSTKSDLRWTPIVDKVQLDRGIVAVEMTSSEDLRALGRAEKHCVGGYVSHILNVDEYSANFIFALQQADEADQSRILSTIEIKGELVEADRRRQEPERVVWNVKQHSAKRNAPPCAAAKTAAKELVARMEALSPSDFSSYLEATRSNTTNLRDLLSRTILAMKANITNPDIAETSLEVHAEILPKRLRDLKWDDWHAKIAQKRSESYDDGFTRCLIANDLAEIKEGVERIEMKLKKARLSLSPTEPEM